MKFAVLVLVLLASFVATVSAQNFNPPLPASNSNVTGSCQDNAQVASICQFYTSNYTIFVGSATTMDQLNALPSSGIAEAANKLGGAVSCIDKLARIYCGDAFRKCDTVTSEPIGNETASAPAGLCRSICEELTGNSLCMSLYQKLSLSNLVPDCTAVVPGMDVPRYPVDGYNISTPLGDKFIPCFYNPKKPCSNPADITCAASTVIADFFSVVF